MVASCGICVPHNGATAPVCSRPQGPRSPEGGPGETTQAIPRPITDNYVVNLLWALRRGICEEISIDAWGFGGS